LKTAQHGRPLRYIDRLQADIYLAISRSSAHIKSAREMHFVRTHELVTAHTLNACLAIPIFEITDAAFGSVTLNGMLG
jgi:hypothetical protein